jgi:hypothetical protein
VRTRLTPAAEDDAVNTAAGGRLASVAAREFPAYDRKANLARLNSIAAPTERWARD